VAEGESTALTRTNTSAPAQATAEVRPVRSRRELRAFIRLPWRLYAQSPCWVPPLLVSEKARLDPRKNPYLEHATVQLFVAWRGREPVGRIAAHVNHAHNRYWHDEVGFFGFFECIEDYAVAKALWLTAAEWLRERGRGLMRGPMNFSTNEELGFLADGFDKLPAIMMPYTHAYYLDFAARFGLGKAMDLLAWHIDSSTVDLSRYEKLADRIRERVGFTLRNINKRDYAKEVVRIKTVYNDAWSRNWGFVPMTDREFEHFAKEVKPLVRPACVQIAEKDGEPIAFCISLPDVNKILARMNGRLFPTGLFKLMFGLKKLSALRTITLGTRRAYQKRGIESVFLVEIVRRTVAAGYRTSEMGWTLETNHMINKPLERMAGRLDKRYRIVEMPL
jgi:GNAT superfamily N-acetyltransferase